MKEETYVGDNSVWSTVVNKHSCQLLEHTQQLLLYRIGMFIFNYDGTSKDDLNKAIRVSRLWFTLFNLGHFTNPSGQVTTEKSQMIQDSWQL